MNAAPNPYPVGSPGWNYVHAQDPYTWLPPQLQNQYDAITKQMNTWDTNHSRDAGKGDATNPYQAQLSALLQPYAPKYTQQLGQTMDSMSNNMLYIDNNGQFIDPNAPGLADKLLQAGTAGMLALATGGVLNPMLTGSLGTIGAGTVSGAVGGGLGSLVTTGDFGKGVVGGAVGGLTSGLMGASGLNNYVSNAVGGGEFGKVIGNAASGAIGGALGAGLTGRDIGMGAISGGLSGGLKTAFGDATNAMGVGNQFGSAIGGMAAGQLMQSLGTSFKSGGPTAMQHTQAGNTMSMPSLPPNFSPVVRNYSPVGGQGATPQGGNMGNGFSGYGSPVGQGGTATAATNTGWQDPGVAPDNTGGGGSNWLGNVAGAIGDLYGMYSGYKNATNPLYNSSSTSTLPAWIQNQYGTALAGVNQDPYRAYGGPMVAGFNPDQNAAFNAARNNFGKYNDVQDLAINNANGMTGGFSAGDVQNWMNPYQQNVIDTTMAQLEHAHQQGLEDVNNSAELAHAFGGDRAAVQKGVADANYYRDAASTLAGLNSSNYTQALNAANNNFANKLQGNNALQGAIANARAGNTADMNNLYASGAIQQGNAQKQLDANYQEFLRQQGSAQTHIQNLLQSMGMLPRNIGTTNSYGPQQDKVAAMLSGLNGARGPGGATATGAGGLVNAGVSALKNIFGGMGGGGITNNADWINSTNAYLNSPEFTNAANPLGGIDWNGAASNSVTGNSFYNDPNFLPTISAGGSSYGPYSSGYFDPNAYSPPPDPSNYVMADPNAAYSDPNANFDPNSWFGGY